MKVSRNEFFELVKDHIARSTLRNLIAKKIVLEQGGAIDLAHPQNLQYVRKRLGPDWLPVERSGEQPVPDSKKVQRKSTKRTTTKAAAKKPAASKDTRTTKSKQTNDRQALKTKGRTKGAVPGAATEPAPDLAEEERKAQAAASLEKARQQALLKERLEIDRKQHEAEIARMKLDKMRGELIPTSLVREMFALAFREITTEFMQGAESYSLELLSRYDLDKSHFKEMRENLVAITNHSVERSRQQTYQGLEDLVKQTSGTKAA